MMKREAKLANHVAHNIIYKKKREIILI
uniref:Uncharacterized protein n=1 Tax=Rhizophora mucronata TaxID=61149 RepID=A0A2P2P3G6_RHIMU